MDKVLKQRLVGASILIALAVIFLPMLFDGGDNDSVEQRERALDLPERQSGERQVRRLALDPDEARRTAPSESRADPPADDRPAQPVREPRPQPVEEASSQADPEPDAMADADDSDIASVAGDATQDEPPQQPVDEQPEPVEQAAEPEAAEESTSTEPEPEAGEQSAPVEGRWVVQVAVFSSRETANSIRQRLDELGHRVTMDVLIRDQAELFRLRTGPYGGEATAEQARGQIAATVAGMDPVTRELSGQGAAEDRHGLAVQVGSFASHNNAERLVGQLTDAGFDAFMYGEETGGRTIWRVRVGGYEQRADADRLLETLRDEQGLEGIVVSHP
jgi:cell division septation protein DedD